MKAIMIMYDSLNRHMLPPYGAKNVCAPNFERLCRRAATFDNAYVGSMPCMPARRELHTGRYNFLHRAWGPIEPFDDSMPAILEQNGIHSHLATDHYHYFEDGGATYHTRYSSWEAVRGQEGDPWKANLDPAFEIPDNLHFRGKWARQDFVNRSYMDCEQKQSQTLTFDAGIEFLEKNSGFDNWFLQIETFDPHEPWFTHQHYKDLYPHEYDGPFFDWPCYGRRPEADENRGHLQNEYYALLSMCDRNLGRVLDFMDENRMWDDTMLIVNTDHGFLIGENGWWGKCYMPFYGEVAHTPLFIYDPREKEAAGQRRGALVQTIDLAPTLLEFFGLDRPKDMQGVPLRETICSDKPIRKGALFGIHGGQVNVTDGRYVYMRGPKNPSNTPLYSYTLMPTKHGKSPAFMSLDELSTARLAPPFSFTKGLQVLKLDGKCTTNNPTFPSALYDLQTDPTQQNPIEDEAVLRRMTALMIKLMRENDCPEEQFERLGL